MSYGHLYRAYVWLLWLFLVLLAIAVVVIWRDLNPLPAMRVDQMTVFEDGHVVFSRTVTDDHFANWIGEVRRPGETGPLCIGSGVSHYEPGRADFVFRIEDFVGPSCPATLPPGSILVVEWVPTSPHIAPVRRAALVESCPCNI